MYVIIKKVSGVLGNTENIINKESGLIIPKDLENRHYIEYLSWIEDGNMPEIIEEDNISESIDEVE